MEYEVSGLMSMRVASRVLDHSVGGNHNGAVQLVVAMHDGLEGLDDVHRRCMGATCTSLR